MRDSELGIYAIATGVVVGMIIGVLHCEINVKPNILQKACGVCDDVKECGAYQCRAGVEGWHLKK